MAVSFENIPAEVRENTVWEEPAQLSQGAMDRPSWVSPKSWILPYIFHIFSSVLFSRSVVSDFLRPYKSQHTRPPCPSPTPGVHSDSHPSNSDAIQPSHPLSSPSVPPTNPSSIRDFSNESTLRMRWPKYWSFSFSILPSTEIPGLISFRMDWLDLLSVQGTLKSLLQH